MIEITGPCIGWGVSALVTFYGSGYPVCSSHGGGRSTEMQAHSTSTSQASDYVTFTNIPFVKATYVANPKHSLGQP